MRRSLLALAGLLASVAYMPAPAAASTIPTLSLPAGKVNLAAGLGYFGPGAYYDLNVDAGVTDRLSLGLTALGTSTPFVLGARATYRLGEVGSLRTGLTFSAGGMGTIPGFPQSSIQLGPWGQLALNGELPLGRFATLRATLGPVFPDVTRGSLYAWLWPNLELAFPIAPAYELTLGGNSILGVRGTF